MVRICPQQRARRLVIHRRLAESARRAEAGDRGVTGRIGLPGIPRRKAMSQGGYVTLVGFVAQDPSLRPIKDGRNVTNLRVGATRRYLDKATGEWRDLETTYYDVSCWNRLADHVRASMRKGEPGLGKGQFKSRSWEDKNGQIRNQIDILADTVGHDLSRGVANYIRPRPWQQGLENTQR